MYMYIVSFFPLPSLSLSPLFPLYQEIQPGVNQYLYSCIQSHRLWQSTRFWCHSLYSAIQAELVRLYAEVPFNKKPKTIEGMGEKERKRGRGERERERKKDVYLIIYLSFSLPQRKMKMN